MVSEDRKMTMLDYIKEAPGVARDNISRRSKLVAPLVAACGEGIPSRITIVASGSSSNASLCARPFMRSCLPACDVRVINPFTFVHYEREFLKDEFAVVVTQSGLSTNAIEALDHLRSNGVPAICLTGNTKADAADHADIIIDYGVDVELVGYVTKGVTTLALFLMLFAIELSGADDRVPELIDAIDASEAVARVTEAFYLDHLKDLTSMSVCYCMGAGSTWGVASEGALKIGETIHIPSLVYEVEEFIHGPNLQLTPEYTTVFFDAGDASSNRVKQVWRAAREVTDRAYLVTCDDGMKGLDGVLAVPALCNPMTASLAFLPFVQLISYFVSDALGSSKQHPLLRRFKKVAASKTENFVNYDDDE